MSTIIKVVLTFTNPAKSEFVALTNLLTNSVSINQQQIYITRPETQLLHYSCEKNDNIKLSHLLSQNEITTEFIEKIKKELK